MQQLILKFNFITITDSNNWFRISQIRILKNFIETKINFSPSPLWFSKSVLWVLAPTFHDSSPKPSLLIQQHVYTQRKEKKKTLYNRSFWHNQLIQRYSCAGISLLSNSLLSTGAKCVHRWTRSQLILTVIEVQYSNHVRMLLENKIQ